MKNKFELKEFKYDDMPDFLFFFLLGIGMLCGIVSRFASDDLWKACCLIMGLILIVISLLHYENIAILRRLK